MTRLIDICLFVAATLMVSTYAIPLDCLNFYRNRGSRYRDIDSDCLEYLSKIGAFPGSGYNSGFNRPSRGGGYGNGGYGDDGYGDAYDNGYGREEGEDFLDGGNFGNEDRDFGEDNFGYDEPDFDFDRDGEDSFKGRRNALLSSDFQDEII